MKLILTALYSLLLGTAWPAMAATPPTDAAKQAHEKRLRTELKELGGYLAESHQGLRGDDERYVILHRMLQDYGLLKSTGTPEAQAAIQEWHGLLKAHPEYKAHPPRLEIREQREARERQAKARSVAQEKSPTWTPQDATAEQIFGSGNRAIVKYQYRIEFFKLPDADRISAMVDFARAGQAATKGGLKPFKTMTFKHSIDTGPLPPLKPFDHPIWICTDIVAKYAAHTDEERAAIGLGKSWVNASGEYEDFCGAVSFDGDVIYKLNVAQHYPDKLLRVLEISSDGHKASIGLGKMVIDEEDEGELIGKFNTVFVWEYPAKLDTIDASDKSRAKEALQQHGLSPSVLGY